MITIYWALTSDLYVLFLVFHNNTTMLLLLFPYCRWRKRAGVICLRLKRFCGGQLLACFLVFSPLCNPIYLIVGWSKEVLLRNITWPKWWVISSRLSYKSDFHFLSLWYFSLFPLWFPLSFCLVLLFPSCLFTLMKQLPCCKILCREAHVTEN